MNALPSSPPPSREDDRSQVRSRPLSEAGAERTTQLDRPARMESKIKQAQALLDSLPREHAQARLLRIAIVRRDETLIDNIIEQIGRGMEGSGGNTGMRRASTVLPPRDPHGTDG